MQTHHASRWHCGLQNGGAGHASHDTRDSVLQDAEAGVPYSTAGKSVVLDESRRLLVSKDGDNAWVIIESQHSEVRRLRMAVKPKTQRGQWSSVLCLVARSHAKNSCTVVPHQSTPNG